MRHALGRLLHCTWVRILLKLLRLLSPLVISLHRRRCLWGRWRGIALLIVLVLSYWRLISILLWFGRRSWCVLELPKIGIQRFMWPLRPGRDILRWRWNVNTWGRVCIRWNVRCNTLTRQRRRYIRLPIILTVCIQCRRRDTRHGSTWMLELLCLMRRWEVRATGRGRRWRGCGCIVVRGLGKLLM
jgi:hypothetical protein